MVVLSAPAALGLSLTLSHSWKLMPLMGELVTMEASAMA